MRAKVGKFLIFLGALFIALALLLGGYSVYHGLMAGKKADHLAYEMSKLIELQMEGVPEYMLNPDMEMPVLDIEGEACIGILEIPAIDKKLPVISQWEYDKLRTAPCRYAGSAYKDNMVIAAHNYAAHFGDLAKLEPQDAVFFVDADGNLFQYQVIQIEVLNPEDVEEMKTGMWDLTLFTCDSSLTHRVTVRCEKMH